MADVNSSEYWSDAKQVDVKDPAYWSDAQVMDAPDNSVFDQDKGRVISMPQTLNAIESEFLIKRDADQVRDFFGMVDMGAWQGAGRGVGRYLIGDLPQAATELVKQKAELAESRKDAPFPTMQVIDNPLKLYGLARDKILTSIGTEDIVQKMNDLKLRNEKYVADNGWEPEGEGLGLTMYNFARGGGSVAAAMGAYAATRSPAAVTLMLGAIQKSAIGKEYTERKLKKGETVDLEEREDISDIAAAVEMALGYVGLGRFGKAISGNSAVKKFVSGGAVAGAVARGVARYAEGGAVEAVQEGTQAIGEEVITQTTDVRDRPFDEAAKDILAQAAAGFIIGGGTATVLGGIARKEAEEKGMDEKSAKALGEYVEKNLPSVKTNMTEFIDKELAPVAADNKSAQEFITLMQKFGNNEELVKRDTLSVEDKKVFDEYIEMFNTAKIDKVGVKEVEKTFFDQAVEAGVAEDQATGAAKLVGARADAASRALGVSPMEWYKAKNIKFGGGEKSGDEAAAADADLTEAQSIKASLMQKRSTRGFNRNDPAQVQRKVGLPAKPQSVLQFIRSKGGISLGMTAEELSNVKAARKSKGKSASKASMASEEITRLFDGQKGKLSSLLSEKGLGLDELQELLEEAGYMERAVDADENLSADKTQEVLDLIEREAQGDKIYPVDVELALQDQRDTESQNFDYLDQIGIDESMSAEEIAAVLRERRAGQEEFIRTIEDEIPFNQGDKNPRGSVTFGKNETIINLFEGANASTLLHELGHIFLRDMRDIAAVTKRPRVKADYEAVKKWLGVKGDTFTVAQEEKFARGFEAYLREGKAPKPELQGIFDTFKKWLTQIYRRVQELNVNVSPQVKEVFDRMLGGDFAQAETLKQEEAARSIEDDYETVAQMKPEGTFAKDTGDVFRSVHDWGGNAFVPVSTRLGNIDQALKHAVRKFVFQTGLYTHEDHQVVKPFIEKVSDTFSEEDYRIFDLSLKNRDTVKADFLVDKYGIQEEWGKVREVLDGLYIEGRDVGLDINYIEEYFPRKVKKGMALEYMAAMRGHEAWSEIEQALKEADPDNDFTTEEQAAFVNSFLRGFRSSRVNLSKPSFTKERTVDYITPQFNKYYEDSMPTLIEYIGALRHSIEARRLFGKAQSDRDTNIGGYVLSLVRDGIVDAKQENELKELLKAVVEPNGTHGFWGWAKNATYIYTMGSPTSAITQLGDLAFSLHKNGYYRTIKSLTKSLTGNQTLKKEDLGIDNILQEYEENTRAANAVRTVFKVVGITFMDNVGKETYIGASLERLQSAAKKGGASFDKQMEIVFGDQASTVKADLIAGNMTEDVKYLLFSELSDVQPISLAEMPLHYLKGGNLRILYMLKTYTIKQLDIYRREVFSEIASGEPVRVAKGLKNIVSLGVALMMMGMSSDALKDLLLGRDVDLSDLVIDNIIKLMGINKYTIYKAKSESIGDAVIGLVAPPVFSFPSDVWKDINKIGGGDKKLKDSEVAGHVPLIGKFYYWWAGGGVKKKDKKKSKVSSP